jgi:uncharacterized SAM-binding protein YcdF (DUF218 family)
MAARSYSAEPRLTEVEKTSIALRMRWTRTVLVLIMVLTAALGTALARGSMLRTIGAALVVEDPVTSADAIVVTIEAGGAGLLEAADLVHAGVANRVAVFAESPSVVDAEFIRRGVRVESKVVTWRRMLAALGVPEVEEIPMPVDGTEAEGVFLPQWCEQRHLRSIVVVTMPDHSRRVRRVLQRAMSGRTTRVSVRPARVSSFDPNAWWHTRSGTRTGIIEFEKLLLDYTRHPIP